MEEGEFGIKLWRRVLMPFGICGTILDSTCFVSESEDGGSYIVWKGECSGSNCGKGGYFRFFETCNSILFDMYFVLDCEEGGVYSGGGDISGSNYGKRVVVLFFHGAVLSYLTKE